MRKIIHVDMDCFYAAIEQRDDPTLRGLPIAVGGSPDRRGVIATASYEARRFGVKSAMPSAHARRLCPDLIIVKPDIARYREDSKKIRAIFAKYTSLIEPLSLDEAYLDVTDSEHCRGSATLMAQAIRNDIREQLQLTASAGIAPNKFLAKIASDWNKPDGQFVITPEEVDDFVHRLPVNKLHGVGKVTARKLENMDIHTCADLQKAGLLTLTRKFGSFGKHLYDLAHGKDERVVKSRSLRKSVSVENTFDSDLQNVDECLEKLPELLSDLSRRLGRQADLPPIAKQLVKLKFDNFVSTTVEATSFKIDLELFRRLMKEGFERQNRPVRLLGVGVRFREEDYFLRLKQLNFEFYRTELDD